MCYDDYIEHNQR